MGDKQIEALSNGLHRVSSQMFDDVLATPHDIKLRVKAFATLARLNTLYMIAKAGSGHIGSSFSSLDIVSWLFLAELNREGATPDVYFSSKGHDAPGLYSVLIALNIIDEKYLGRLRRLDGLPGHPDNAFPGIPFNTGSLGMGISKAKGMLKADSLNGINRRVYVLTGDGELQEGQFWEALPGAVNDDHGNLTVLIDHNKYQSDALITETSDLGDILKKISAFGWHVVRCDGHNYEALENALKSARNQADKPSLILADTVKGCGVDFIEHVALNENDRFYKYHSGALSENEYDRAAAYLREKAQIALAELGLRSFTSTEQNNTKQAATTNENLINSYSAALIDVAKNNNSIVALDADLLIDTGVLPFSDQFPERYFECGIAEQDMVSQAGALACEGFLPFVHSFACFLSTRPNEQIYNNASEHSKVIYVGSLAGILPAGPGHSHQSVRDISALNGIPGLVLIQPSCPEELKTAVRWCAEENESSAYLRICSVHYSRRMKLPGDYCFAPGRGNTIAPGKDVTIISYGPVMLNEALVAHNLLAEVNIGLKVVNLPWLNRLDDNWLLTLTESTSQIITLDDHYIEGGQGEMIAARIADLNIGLPVQRLGLNHFPLCGSNEEVLAAHGLDAESLAHQIKLTISG